MSHAQVCPHCRAENKVAGLYYKTTEDGKGTPAKAAVRCWQCEKTFEPKEDKPQ